MWDFLQRTCVNPASIAPEPPPGDGEEPGFEDDSAAWGGAPPLPPSANREGGEDKPPERVLPSGIKLLGIPEFDIAVRSKLLVGPSTYMMQVGGRLDKQINT